MSRGTRIGRTSLGREVSDHRAEETSEVEGQALVLVLKRGGQRAKMPCSNRLQEAENRGLSFSASIDDQNDTRLVLIHDSGHEAELCFGGRLIRRSKARHRVTGSWNT